MWKPCVQPTQFSCVLQTSCCCVTADHRHHHRDIGSLRRLLHHITMVCAARLSQILVKRSTNGVLTLKAPGAALFYTAGPCGWRRMSSQSQSSRGDRVGPDRILPSNSLSSTWPDGAVEIRFSDKHPLCQEKPISVSDFFRFSLYACLQEKKSRIPFLYLIYNKIRREFSYQSGKTQ